MIDPEVARLRRLRDEALRVREIARRLGTARWAAEDSLLERGACATWRIVRMATGKLVEHPYPRYHQAPGVGTLVGNRVGAEWIFLASKDLPSALKTLSVELESLSRQLGDARALTWSTDFSDALGRSQSELKSLLKSFAEAIDGADSVTASVETRLTSRTARAPSGAVRTDRLAGELAKGFETDWPYLAF